MIRLWDVMLLSINILGLLSSAMANSYCGTVTNSSFYDLQAFDPQSGSANLLKFGLRRPWPKVGDLKHRTIPYCYVDLPTKAKLQCVVMAGLGVWATALGTNHAKSGHSLSWWNTSSKTPPALFSKSEFCYGSNGAWNEKVPKDALAIHESKNGIPHATIGYTPMNQDSTPGRHKLFLPENARSPVVVHELGHVFGMIHEQCRNDRDEFLHFECENIQDFGRAMAAAIKTGEVNWKEKLCEEKDYANRFEFDSAQFTKNYESQIIPGMIDEGNFDFGSVMLYPSHAFSNPECSPDNLDKCPLAQLDKVNGEVMGESYIHENVAPSSGDIAFIKKWYPWEDDMKESRADTQNPTADPSTDTPTDPALAYAIVSTAEINVRVHKFELVNGRVVT